MLTDESSPQEASSLEIFLVENHEDTLVLLQVYLESLGHSVRSAQTMAAALESLREQTATLLLCDIGLPDGDGWELLRRLGSEAPALSVAMSGFGSAADEKRSRDAGFRAHLCKPFLPEQLDEILEMAMTAQR